MRIAGVLAAAFIVVRASSLAAQGSPTVAKSVPEQPPPSGEVTVPPGVAATPPRPAGHAGSRTPAAASSPAASNNSNGGNSSPFAAFDNPNRGPINIQSDSLDLDYKKSVTFFRGHVHATQADGVLLCDTLEVQHGKDFHDVQQMVANGNVRISQGTRWCTGDHAVMNQGAHTVVLTGSPVCRDANDQIAGSKITVYLQTGQSVVEGAKAVIFPRQSKTRDNEVAADHAPPPSQ